MANIHPTAVVEGGAEISESASVGAYAVIDSGARVGAGAVIEPHARLCSGAVIGENCRICGFCTIAGLPQDLHFDPSVQSFAVIGARTVVREGSTVHRATASGGATRIGEDCFIMANAHIGHDVSIGSRVIYAPFAAAGGFAEVGDDTFVSGGVMIHQKVRVGRGVMMSGNSAVSKDVPPYVNAFGRNAMAGFNLVGLVRRKTPRESIRNLKELYSFVYSSGSPRKRALEAAAAGMAHTPEGEAFLDFFVSAPEGRHFLCPPKKPAKEDGM